MRNVARVDLWAPDASVTIGALMGSTFIRRPRLVLLLSALLAVAALAVSGNVQRDLTYGPSNFEDSSSEGARAERAVEAVSGSHPNATLLALVDLPAGIEARRSRQRLRAIVRTLREDPGVVAAVDYYGSGDEALVSRDRHATYVVASLRGAPESAARAAAERLERRFAAAGDVTLGGQALATPQFDEATQEDLRRAELIAAPLILLLLIWVFRGLVAALMPLLVGLLAVGGALFAIRMITLVDPLSVFALNVVTGLGLGLGVDYSLLVVSRFREELRRGATPYSAARRAQLTAGRTVLFSGVTVAVALASLLVFPQPFLYSMGIAGLLVAGLASAVALTVLPAALVVLGPRIDALSLPRWRDGRALRRERRFWRRLASAITAHPRLGAAAATVLLLLLAVPLTSARFAFADAHALPADASVRRVSERLDQEFAPNRTTPILVALGPAAEGQLPAAQIATVRRELARTAGVAAVGQPEARGGRAVLRVVSADPAGSDASRELVRRIRALDAPAPLLVGGDTATFLDLRAGILDHLPAALAIVLLAVLLGQLPLTRSLVLPLKTVLMSALTFLATMGVLVLVFQHGLLEGPLGFHSPGAVGIAESLVVLTLVVAVTTDYAGFMLGRIRESHEGGEGDAEAVSSGLALTGRTVTVAALVLAVAMGAFVSAENVYVKQIGLGVAVAVLLDALVVRVLLVPSLMVLLGRWNWWLPRPLADRLGPVGFEPEGRP